MILHITRHGHVFPAEPGESENTDYRRGDPSLSRLGREQALLLGKRLRKLGFDGRIYSSPYRRSIETAQIIAEVVDTEVAPEARFREYVNLEDDMTGFRGATGHELRAEFSRVRVGTQFPDLWWTSTAETGEDVEARVASLVDELADASSDALLVGHGATLGGATRHVLRNFAPARLNTQPPGWNCALTSFQMSPVFQVIQLADTAHLPPEAVTSNTRTRAEVDQLHARGEL